MPPVNSKTHQKLSFHVVHCSGEDPNFPASELNFHSPQTKGWLSPPFAGFPQEIGIQFDDGDVQVSQLQILSHESKIATKIDVYVGHGADYPSANFKRLGYLSLDSNERSNYAARELKSVYITASGSFVKLLVHKCHINKQNMFNQTGIIAINILGHVLPPGSMSKQLGDATNTFANKDGGHQQQQYSIPQRNPKPTDDLAFDMNFDSVTADLIRQVRQAKDNAVRLENYDQAKRLKAIENQLKTVGAQIAKLETQKRAAVEEEDYDSAQALKHEIARIRSSVDLDALHASMNGGGGNQQHHPHHLPHNNQGMPHPNQQFGGGAGRMRPQPPPGNGRHTEIHHPNDIVIPRQQPPQAMMDPGPPLQSPTNAPQSPHAPLFPSINAISNPRAPAGATVGPPNSGRSHPPHSARGSVAGEDRPLPALVNQANRPSNDDERPLGSARAAGGGAAGPFPPAAATAADQHKRSAAADVATPSPAIGGGAPQVSEQPTPRTDQGLPNDQVDPLEGVEGAEELSAPEAIPASAMNDVQPMVRVFGEYIVRCMFSRQVKLRTSALQKVELDMSNGKYPIAGDQQVLAALFSLVQMAVTDKMAQVYVNGLRLLTCALGRLGSNDGGASSSTPRKSEVHAGLDAILSTIVDKLGDSNGRVREGSHEILVQLFRLEIVGAPFIASSIIRKQKRTGKNSNLWKPVRKRLVLMKEIVSYAGLSDNTHSPLSLEAVMRLITDCNGHGHPSSEVRDAARDLTMEAYRSLRMMGRRTEDLVDVYLVDLRPKQLEEYQAGFSHIDGSQKVSVEIGGESKPPPASDPKAHSPAPKEPRPASARSHQQAKQAAPDAEAKQPVVEAVLHDDDPTPTNTGTAPVDDDKVDPYEASMMDEPFTCQFCFRHDPEFNEENLDVHYWRECPMLTSCPQCEQVIEVAMLNEHLLGECEKKHNHKQCPRCGEAIALQYYTQHVQRNSCRKMKIPEEANRCPLCHKDIPPADEGWREHLLGRPGCAKNPRTNMASFE